MEKLPFYISRSNSFALYNQKSHGKSIILCKKSVNSVFSIVELSLRQCAKDTWLSHICKFSLSPRHSITKILIQYQCNYSQLKQSTVQKKTQKHIKHIPGQFFSWIGEKKTQNRNLKSTVQKKHKNTQNTCLSHFFRGLEKTQKHIKHMGLVTWSKICYPKKTQKHIKHI